MQRYFKVLFVIIFFIPLLASCKSEWKLEYSYDWLKISSHDLFNGIKIYYRQAPSSTNAVAHVVCYKHNAITANELMLAKVLEIYSRKIINNSISDWEQNLYLNSKYISPLNSSCFHAYVPKNLLSNWLLLEHKRMTRLTFSSNIFKESVSELYQELLLEGDNPHKSIDYLIGNHLNIKHPSLANKLLQLQRMSISKLSTYYKKVYTPENAFFIVSGAIEEIQYKQLIAKIFGSVNRSNSTIKNEDEVEFTNRPIPAGPVTFSLPNSIFPYIVWQWPAFSVINEKSFNKRIASMLVFNDLLTNPQIGLFNLGEYFSPNDIINIKSSYSDDYYFSQPHESLLTVIVTLDPDRIHTTEELIKIVKNFELKFGTILLNQITENHVAILKQNQFFKYQNLNRDGTESLNELLPNLISANADTQSIQNLLSTISEVSIDDIWLLAQYFTKTKPYIYTFIPKKEE